MKFRCGMMLPTHVTCAANWAGFANPRRMTLMARQDPVNVDPTHYSVETENERVRVLRAKYGPREKSKMHGHPAHLAVFLTEGRFRFTYPDGKSEEIAGKAGQVLYLDALEHDPENLSDRPFEAILVELKR
jgi:beta-alanine degradation protein BauB